MSEVARLVAIILRGSTDEDLGLPGYETIALQTTLLSELPSQISSLNETLTSLYEQLASQSNGTDSSESLSLPLTATRSLLSQRQEELSNLDKQLKALQQALPAKDRDLDVEEREVKVVET